LSSDDSDRESYCTSKRQTKLPRRYQSNVSSDDENLASRKQHINSEKRTKRPAVPFFPEFQGKNISMKQKCHFNHF